MSEVAAPKLLAALTLAPPPSLEPALALEAAQYEQLSWAQQTADRLSLDGLRLVESDMTSAKLRSGGWTDVEIKGGMLAGLDVAGSFWRRIAVYSVRADGLVMSEVTAKDVMFRDCKLDLANFRFGAWARVRFENCSLREADFMGLVAKQVEFVRCDLTGAQFAGAKLVATDLRTSTLIDLSGLSGLAGATISLSQLLTLAPRMAAELGLTIAD